MTIGYPIISFLLIRRTNPRLNHTFAPCADGGGLRASIAVVTVRGRGIVVARVGENPPAVRPPRMIFVVAVIAAAAAATKRAQ